MTKELYREKIQHFNDVFDRHIWSNGFKKKSFSKLEIQENDDSARGVEAQLHGFALTC